MKNEIKIIAGNAHPDLAAAVARNLDLPLTPAEFVRFSNENIMFQVQDNIREADVFVIQPSCSPVSEGIVEMLIMMDTLKHASAARVTAVIPYFPYARSDKKDKPRISITARLMADLLETAGANRVLTMNLHSPQVQGFFRMPVDQLNANPLLCEHLRSTRDLSNTVLVAGDVGEAKDVGEFAQRLNLPLAVIDKRRFGDDESPKAVNIIGDVKGKRALIVDDEISSGGTMIEAARFLIEQGVTGVDAAVVHPILAGRAVERLSDSPIESLLVTDSVPLTADKRAPMVEQISVAGLIADAIHAIHAGESVSSIFR